MEENKQEPCITRASMRHCQVCVPESWTPEQAGEWLETQNPAGTSDGWIFVDSSEQLSGDQPIVKCKERSGFVHLVFVL